MRQQGRSDAQFSGEPPEVGGSRIIAHLRVVVGQWPINSAGQRPGLHRADAHHADPVSPRRGHDRARFRRPVEELQPARRIQ